MDDRFQSVAVVESICQAMPRFMTSDREAPFQRASDGQVTACCTFNQYRTITVDPGGTQDGGGVVPSV